MTLKSLSFSRHDIMWESWRHVVDRKNVEAADCREYQQAALKAELCRSDGGLPAESKLSVDVTNGVEGDTAG